VYYIEKYGTIKCKLGDKMENIEAINNLSLILKVLAVLGTFLMTGLVFFLKSVWAKLEKMEEKFEKRFDKIEETLKEHGNRLTAIETGLKMFEWFEFKRSKVEGDK
jgi:uncharacterized protein YabN with tetrapyrrole methylase and pyrophosphatase domain